MNKSAREPRVVTEQEALRDLDPHWRWNRALQAPGHTNVDFEVRVDFRRLHRYRLGRAKEALKASKLGALLVFDVNNIRYLTGTKIGEWERDKLCRFALLAGDNEPVLWDFGSAAVHHRLYCDWLPEANFRAGMLGMRGTVPPSAGLMKRHAEEIAGLLKEAGVAGEPLGTDLVEPGMWFALQEAGLKVADGQQVMLDAREIKNVDEITLLNQAAAMVDGVYHMIYEELKPGVRENDIVAKANKMLYEMGSDDVEAINAISGERCNPHPHNFTDRMIRPGDQCFFDILQAFMGYRTCYYRTSTTPSPASSPAPRPHTSARCSRRRTSSASRTSCRRSACSSRTDLASRCMSGRSSRAWCRWIIRLRSRRAWCSRSRLGRRRPTAIRPPASRRRLWSPTRAAS